MDIKIDLDLEEECWRCRGARQIREEDQKLSTSKLITCPVCKGVGIRPTEFGSRILDFMAKYFEPKVPLSD